MKIDKDDPLLKMLFAGAIILLFAIGCWVFQSNREAAAYNSVTGANVSTWDAMWIELRVVGQSPMPPSPPP